jgi:hypothetical protein
MATLGMIGTIGTIGGGIGIVSIMTTCCGVFLNIGGVDLIRATLHETHSKQPETEDKQIHKQGRPA